MIIFDLDGTLADCSHRRHYVDPKANPGYKRRWSPTLDECENNLLIPEEYIPINTSSTECLDKTYIKFKPNWKAFFEACDQDTPIDATLQMLSSIFVASDYTADIRIWSGRCESVRAKTEKWLHDQLILGIVKEIKMRPIGDSTPDDQLKERWYDEHNALHPQQKIEFVVDDRPKVLRMWQRRGVFTFDVGQGRGEF